MSYQEYMEEIVEKLRAAADLPNETIKPALIHYGQRIIDMGTVADKLSDDVERLSRVVNLIELTNERDELKGKVEALEKKIAEGGMIY